MAGETKIDIMFIESQLGALKAYADKTLHDDCVIGLYSDGSVDVERASGTSYAFDTILSMTENLAGYKYD